MASSSLYCQLVPDAPLYRRTDHDIYASPESERRAKLASRLARPVAQPGLQKPALVSSWRAPSPSFCSPAGRGWCIASRSTYDGAIEDLRRRGSPASPTTGSSNVRPPSLETAAR